MKLIGKENVLWRNKLGYLKIPEVSNPHEMWPPTVSGFSCNDVTTVTKPHLKGEDEAVAHDLIISQAALFEKSRQPSVLALLANNVAMKHFFQTSQKPTSN